MEDLRRILGHSRWNLVRAENLSAAQPALERPEPRVVVCEATLEDGTWRDVLRRALSLPLPPPVVVTAKHADDHLWMDVLNSGGYNVLGRPFQEQEVFRILSTAWLHHRENGLERAQHAALG